VIHFACYIIAGVIDLQLAKKMYSGKNRLYKSFFRDMDVTANLNEELTPKTNFELYRSIWPILCY